MKNQTLNALCCSVLMGMALGQEPNPSTREALQGSQFRQVQVPEAERGTPRPSIAEPEQRGEPQYIPTTKRPLDAAAPEGGLQMPPPSIDFDQVYWNQTDSDRHWVRGETFKASFGAQGFQYIPFLGPDAPRNFPVRSRLESVSIAGEAMALSDADKAVREGNRVTFDRGAVEVRYDVGLKGIEQSFSFANLPTHGDVVLRLNTTTDLIPVAHGDGWRFANDFGGVDVGGAQVFDATGETMKLTTTWMDGILEVTVPQGFLKRAVAPILVDPLFSTFLLDSVDNKNLQRPDIAYGYTDDRYCVVYEFQFSATDIDVWSRILEGLTGAPSGIDNWIDMTDESWTNPVVAYQLNDNIFMVVAESRQLGSNRRSLRGQLRNSFNQLTYPAFTIQAQTGAAECRTPDIGGDVFASSASYFVIVWERDYGTDGDIWMATYHADGSVRTAPSVLHQDTTKNLTEPVISQSTGILSSNPKFNIAWLSRDLTLTAAHVYGQQASYQGTLLGNRFTVATAPGTGHYFDLDVSELVNKNHTPTGEPLYLITVDNAGVTAGDMLLLMFAGENVVDSASVPFVEMRASNLDRDAARIATTSDTWIVAYSEYSGANLVDIRTVMLQPVPGGWGGVEDPFLVLADQRYVGNEFNELAICSTVSGGGPPSFRDAIMAWSFDPITDALQIAGARVYAEPGEINGYLYCYGEPNSTGEQAYLIARGDTGTTNFKTLKTTRMPIGQFCYTLAGTDPVNIPFAGGSDGVLCVGGNVGRYNLSGEIGFSGATGEFTFQINPGQIRQAGPSATAMAGQTWRFQTWFRDGAAGPGHSNFSNGVAIPFE